MQINSFLGSKRMKSFYNKTQFSSDSLFSLEDNRRLFSSLLSELNIHFLMIQSEIQIALTQNNKTLFYDSTESTQLDNNYSCNSILDFQFTLEDFQNFKEKITTINLKEYSSFLK